jgi:biotin carboxylase
VLTLSETGIVAVADACKQLGLRGPGPGVLASRDKMLMRERWREAGLPQPAFAPVRSRDDLVAAAGRIRRPFLLKPSWLAGSLAQVLIEDGSDLDAAWRKATEALGRVGRAGVRDFLRAGGGPQFIAEEIIEASTEPWYDVLPYGDCLSVEGLVVGGRYHPVAITARMPTLPPFIEVGFHSPAALPEEAQRRVEVLARAAVDALDLEFCATHTEIKLQAGGGLCLLESAARLGGSMIARLVEEAFDVDLIGLQAGTLLGRADTMLPERLLISGRTGRFVASLMVMAADSSGRPWDLQEPLVYRPDPWTGRSSRHRAPQSSSWKPTRPVPSCLRSSRPPTR